MHDKIRYLLLQVRRTDDPMRSQEVECFARVLGASIDRIAVYDLLNGPPSQRELGQADLVLLGGSGDFSVVQDNPWLEAVLDGLRQMCESGKPTFASCWGFQAIARAMGGLVVHDPQRAEIGTHELRVTDEGQADPVFGLLGQTFEGQMGHEDCVDLLPEGATRLASSVLVPNQAYRLEGKPVYATQFHPELNRWTLIERARTYPKYISKILGQTLEEFAATCRDTPATEALLPHFVRHVFGQE